MPRLEFVGYISTVVNDINNMPKQILVPTDFSKNALNAINYALKLFKGQDIRLCK